MFPLFTPIKYLAHWGCQQIFGSLEIHFISVIFATEIMSAHHLNDVYPHWNAESRHAHFPYPGIDSDSNPPYPVRELTHNKALYLLCMTPSCSPFWIYSFYQPCDQSILLIHLLPYILCLHTHRLDRMLQDTYIWAGQNSTYCFIQVPASVTFLKHVQIFKIRLYTNGFAAVIPDHTLTTS